MACVRVALRFVQQEASAGARLCLASSPVFEYFCSRSSRVVLAVDAVQKRQFDRQHLFPYCTDNCYDGHLREFQLVAKAALQRPGVRKAIDMELTSRLRGSRSRRDNSDALYAPGQKSPVTRVRVRSYNS